MRAQATIKLTGPMDHLRLVWQTGETMLETVPFAEDPEGTRYNVLLALQEMVTNVLRHAYSGDEHQPIEVAFAVEEEQLHIELRDRGRAFDPLRYRVDVVDEADALPTEVGGFGIPFARAVMDDVGYVREGGWNCLRLTKRFRKAVHA
ncbi:MAG: ATP-binding protein [Planctomycetota bacterium]